MTSDDSSIRVALACTYASFVEVNMVEAFEMLGIKPWIVKSQRARFEYRQSGVKYETYRKTIELPCILDNHLLRQYAPFPIIPSLHSTIQTLHVDIVNVSEYVSTPAWILSLLKGRWRVVLTQHGYGAHRTVRDRIYDYLARNVLVKRIDAFVAIGLRAKIHLESLGARNVAVIPNPINEELFRTIVPYEERQEAVLFVGKADTSRGVHLLIDAMKEARKNIGDLKLLLAGDRGNLSAHLARYEWAQHLGPIPHLEMPQYYNMAKVFANPVPGEAGCGSALEEALACGTPVVGTTHLDFPFLWKDGEVGYVVKPSADELADGIVQALDNGGRLSAKCREVALRQFSQRSVGSRYLQLFKETLGRQ